MTVMSLPNRRTEIRVANTDKLYIGGRWVAAKKGGRIQVVSPQNENVVFTVAEATESDMDDAVSAARRAFDSGPWPRLTHQEGAADWRKLSRALAPRLPELSRAWVEQTGALASVAPFVIG